MFVVRQFVTKKLYDRLVKTMVMKTRNITPVLSGGGRETVVVRILCLLWNKTAFLCIQFRPLHLTNGIKTWTVHVL